MNKKIVVKICSLLIFLLLINSSVLGQNENQCGVYYFHHKDASNPLKYSFTLQYPGKENQISPEVFFESYKWYIDNVEYNAESLDFDFQFSEFKYYKVKFEFYTANGCSDSIVKNINVIDQNSDCYADFYADTIPSNQSFSGGLQFIDISSAPYGIEVSKWFFGEDSIQKSGREVFHSFITPGNYSVCLEISNADNSCVADTCKEINIPEENDHQECDAKFSFVQDTNDLSKVSFEDESTTTEGSILNWFWDFGDSSSSDQSQDQNPFHEYSGNGNYTVQLIINTDNYCEDTLEQDVYIHYVVPENCKSNFEYFQDIANNDEYDFINNSELDSGADLSSSYWEVYKIGQNINIDGNSSDFSGNGNYKDFSFDFENIGNYEVCLTIYTNTGCTDKFCDSIEAFNQYDNTCQANYEFKIEEDTVKFTNTSEGDFTNIKYVFGDGTHSNDTNPSKVYSQSGTFPVCINIMDDNSGCVSNYCEIITVLKDTNDIYCSADFEIFPLGEKKYAFYNKSAGSFTDANWEFNGGENVIKGDSVEFEFSSSGFFEVCLSVFDLGSECLNSNCKTVEIIDDSVVNCRADFDVFDLGNGKVGFNSKTEGVYNKVYFSLGDGMVKEKEQFSHFYQNEGYYDVCMAIYHPFNGCQDQHCKKVSVSFDTTSVFCEAKMDLFTDSNGKTHFINLSNVNYIQSYWDFGDGYHSNDSNPTHSYSKSGFYEVCLNVLDPTKGCQSKVCDNVYVKIDSNQINCSADFNFMVLHDTVIFENTSLGSSSHAHWKFDDGTFSNRINSDHKYNNTGAYNVCLDIFDDVTGCQDNICRDVIILKDTTDVFCEAKFDKIQLTNGEIQFKNVSIGNFSDLYWDLGNGVFAHHEDPIGNYSKEGVYSVTLNIRDSTTACQSSKTQAIVISEKSNQAECYAKFEYFPINDSLVQFKNTSQGAYSKARWDFGDGNFSKDLDEFTYEFSKEGFYQVCLSLYDENSGCQDNVCKNVELFLDTNIFDCHASFEFFPNSKNEVVFNNTSMGQFTESYWKFSDGSTSYQKNPINDFKSKGLFGACLTIFDSFSGCQNEFCTDIPIINDTTVYCDADFEFFVDGKTVEFEPKLKGDITEWMWDYNDGFNSNDSFPQYTYENDGVYEVCLTVFNSVSECFNTYCDNVSILTDLNDNDNYVEVDFSYYLDPNDAKVHFKDESVGKPTNWYWDFGDSDAAGYSQNPVYEYSEDGYYEVCLTVNNSDGGQETKCQIITVGDVSDACFSKFDFYANSLTATAHFDNKSLGRISNYKWDFGDSLTSIQYQPSHTYSDTGFYAGCLTVSNDSGCVRTFCKEIRVGNALENKCLIGCVWPGDANLDLEANHYDILPIGMHYGETGPKRNEIYSVWKGYKSQDWSKQLWGDVNNKHGDANGDGIIDFKDIEIIEKHFAYSHPFQPRGTSKNQLSVDWDIDNIEVGEIAALTVSIPDTIDVSIYGLGFEIDLDPVVFDYGTLEFDFSDSWLGTENDDLITFGFYDENLGKIYIAETRNDHQELSGNGELVKVYVTAKANSSNTGAILTTEGGVTAQGDTVEFNGGEDGTNVNSIDDRDDYIFKDLVVFPNPTSDNITYSLPNGSVSSDYFIEVFDNVGALIYSGKKSGGAVIQSFKEYDSGIYTLQVTNNKVQYMQKIIVTK